MSWKKGNDTINMSKGGTNLTKAYGHGRRAPGGASPPPPPPSPSPPPPPPPPPPTVPPSVNAPVQGSDLTAIWNLQTSGTGDNGTFANGTWGGSLDSYLTGVGFVNSNVNAPSIFLNVGVGTVTISNYNFSGMNTPMRVYLGGTGTINFVNCRFQTNTTTDQDNGVAFPADINGNLNNSTGTLTVNFTNCTFDRSPSTMASGTSSYSYCRFKNQTQVIWGPPNGNSSVTIDHCYITGGGCNPPASSHVELIQFIPTSPAVGTFTVSNSVFNFIDGQALLGVPAGGNYDWTGAFSVGDVMTALTNTIVIGLTAVNANPLNLNRIGDVLAYGTPTAATITNCIFEAGVFGYTLNENGTGTRPTDGGGNRNFANNPLDSSSFG